MFASLRNHWPEYLIEASTLGLFMISACTFCLLLEHPDSLLRQQLEAPLARRVLMGVAMGLTAIAIIYSPWGKRSGAHMNPAVTLTFLRLGKSRRPMQGSTSLRSSSADSLESCSRGGFSARLSTFRKFSTSPRCPACTGPLER